MDGSLIVDILSSTIAGGALIAAVAAIAVGRRSTLAALEETRRARIDASAPRVVIRTLAARWPPVVPGMTAGTVTPVTPQHVFNIPGQAHLSVVVVCDFELTNEGKTTAFVTLPPGAVPVKGPEQDPDNYSPEWHALVDRRSWQLVLAPGTSQWVVARVGLTVAEWATELADSSNAAALTVKVEARDQLADGVTDQIVIEVLARPLVQSADNSNTWQLTPDRSVDPSVDLVVARVRPTSRQYRATAGEGRKQ